MIASNGLTIALVATVLVIAAGIVIILVERGSE